MQPVYLFFHIEKTAGQTIRDHLIKHMKFHEEFVHYGFYGERLAKETGLNSFPEREECERNKAKVVLGHFIDHQTHKLIPAKKPHYITFLRDPVERMVSLYNFTMYRDYGGQNLPIISFDEWWETGKKQTQVNWLVERFSKRDTQDISPEKTLNLALESLEIFWFVGTVEKFNSDTNYLMDKIGLPHLNEEKRSNVTGVHFKRVLELTPELREKLAPELEIDIELYQKALINF